MKKPVILKDTMKLYQAMTSKKDRCAYIRSDTAEADYARAVTDLRQDKAYQRLSEEIDLANGRCTARTIDVMDVLSLLTALERKIGVPRKALEGTRIYLDPCAQSFPKAYAKASHGSRPQSTQVDVVFEKGAWRVTSVCRDDCGEHTNTIMLSDTAKTAVLSNYRHL